jgi:hypothetical protein
MKRDVRWKRDDDGWYWRRLKPGETYQKAFIHLCSNANETGIDANRPMRIAAKTPAACKVFDAFMKTPLRKPEKEKPADRFARFPESLRDQRRSRDVWLVWATKTDHRGAEVTDLRSIEESELGSEFVKECLAMNEPEAEVFIEKRVTHHIYAQRNIEMTRRLASLRRDGD